MRLIGTLDEEKKARLFSAYLLQQEIVNTYEPYFDSDQKKQLWGIWIENEDDLGLALECLEEFKKDHDQTFQTFQREA